MRIIEKMSEEEKQIFINEFIVTDYLVNIECVSIALLQFLREKKMKIENSLLLNELYDRIEQKILA